MLITPGIDIGNGRLLSDVTRCRPDLRRVHRGVGLRFADLGHSEKNVEGLKSGGEVPFDRASLDDVLTLIPDQERRSVGIEAETLHELDLARGERTLIEDHVRHAPVVLRERMNARLEQRLVVEVALLQMLRGHEEPLRPDELARVDHPKRNYVADSPAEQKRCLLRCPGRRVLLLRGTLG